MLRIAQHPVDVAFWQLQAVVRNDRYPVILSKASSSSSHTRARSLRANPLRMVAHALDGRAAYGETAARQCATQSLSAQADTTPGMRTRCAVHLRCGLPAQPNFYFRRLPFRAQTLSTLSGPKGLSSLSLALFRGRPLPIRHPSQSKRCAEAGGFLSRKATVARSPACDTSCTWHSIQKR